MTLKRRIIIIIFFFRAISVIHGRFARARIMTQQCELSTIDANDA